MSPRRLLAVFAVLVASLAIIGPASPAHAAAKDPVIVVPGFTTGPIVSIGYLPLVERLEGAGYDVTLLVYPDYGLGDIHANAQRLANTVASVRARTGAAKVDLVAHSMGGLVSRDYVKNLGGSTKVDSLITMGTPHYGTDLAVLAKFLTFGSCIGITACNQMARGSSFLNSLNAGDDTIGNVSYTNIASVNDGIVQPFTTSFLANDGNNTNVKVQKQCPLRSVGHVALPYDGTVYSGIQDALAHRTITLNCFAL